MKDRSFYSVIGIALAVAALGIFTQTAQALSGAIFTTTVDGSIVNENVHYEAKEDVYLDGGPGPRAPSTAAGLPEGDYYFQVTDPSGKDLLSTDHISCRMIHVNADGVIDFVYEGTNYEWSNPDKAWQEVSYQHNQGVDIDHSELGAITVQLYPYDDTPNRGGVYKVWITPVAAYAGDPYYVPVDKKDQVNGENYQPGNYHGFIPRYSKTDNYKVRKNGPPCDPPEITIRKFHDKNVNGVQDGGEEDITGWTVYVKDPLGVVDTKFTEATVLAAQAGTYQIEEETPSGSQQTVSILDDVTVSSYPTANPIVPVLVVDECGGETHEVVFGNVGLGSISACKIFDRNKDGIIDAGEPGIEGWRIELWESDIDGNKVGTESLQTEHTDGSGCAIFDGLLPGLYLVEEVFPLTGGWMPSGPTSYGPIAIESSLDGATLSGTDATVAFTNYCEDTADFDTKGYWHNKNGLMELTQADIDYVNTLAPYATASDYFDDGDEPFDGTFDGGSPDVEAAIGDGIWQGEEIAPAGSAKAEVSQFLVDQNAGASDHYHKEQLAQQLLAFIFNVRHRLGADGLCASLTKPDGTAVSAEELITEAINIWSGDNTAAMTAMSTLLDGFNNNDAVTYVPCEPCPVEYTG